MLFLVEREIISLCFLLISFVAILFCFVSELGIESRALPSGNTLSHTPAPYCIFLKVLVYSFFFFFCISYDFFFFLISGLSP